MSEKPALEDRPFSVEEFLDQLQKGPKTAFLTLRALLKSLGPDVVERAHRESVLYMRARTFAVARIARGRLVLAFPEGDELDDPLGRLLRKGRERHVRLDAADDLDGHVQGFVRQSYVHGR